MRRLHLFEWEDQPWLPRVFRDFITDQLRYTHTQAMRAPVNAAIATRIASVLEGTKTHCIVDLCAGGGGPIIEISRILAVDLATTVDVVLTDLYPNVAAFKALEAESGGRIKARYESTDAANVPPDLVGLRTLFTALHHFPPPLVRRVLEDAVRKGAPIAVFEPLERTARMTMLVGLMSFLRGFTHAAIAGRLTVSRFLVTYVVPIAPAMFAWDGAVSTLRSYTPGELLELAHSVTAPGYHWEAGRFYTSGPYGPMPTTYLIGVP